MFQATLLALLANLFFSGATIGYTSYSKKYGSLWVNSFKSIVSLALIAFLFLLGRFYQNTLDELNLIFMLSGLIGLAVGDFFLVVGFEKIGPARTLLLFGVQPLLFLVLDLFYFREPLTKGAPLGVGFMLLSLLFVFFEKKKTEFNWNTLGIFCGLFGVLLDFSGVLITKWGMNRGDHHVTEVYFWRMLGAVIGLILFHLVFKKPMLKFSFKETIKDRAYFILACVAGTFISLLFYLKAIEIGPLSSVTAVAVTGPLFAGLFEWAVFKKPFTNSLLLSLFCFGIGFLFLT
jgi:drug/metabolite transporter (DMT)-like permease